MIASILAVFGLSLSSRASAAEKQRVRRVRWRGSDGRWHWQGA